MNASYSALSCEQSSKFQLFLFYEEFMSSIPPQKIVSRTELKSCAPSEYLKKYLAYKFKALGEPLSIDFILLLMLIMLAL